MKNNKSRSLLIEIIVGIVLLSILASVFIPAVINAKPDNIRELRKAQIISTDEQGNNLWRVYDKHVGRFIWRYKNEM